MVFAERVLSETAGAGNGLIRPILPRKSLLDFREKQGGFSQERRVPEGTRSGQHRWVKS